MNAPIESPDLSSMTKSLIATFASEVLGLHLSAAMTKDEMIVAVENEISRQRGNGEYDQPDTDSGVDADPAPRTGKVRVRIQHSGITGGLIVFVNGRRHEIPASGNAEIPAEILPALRDSSIQFEEME